MSPCAYIQRFRLVSKSILEISTGGIVTALHLGVRNPKLWSKLNYREIDSIDELWALADKCALSEELDGVSWEGLPGGTFP